MALADLDQNPQPGYAYSGQMNPDGSMGQRYIGGGSLPTGYNAGAFNPNGSLAWASHVTPGPGGLNTGNYPVWNPSPGSYTPISTPDAYARYPWTAGYGSSGPTPKPAPGSTFATSPAPSFNLSALFGGPLQAPGQATMFSTVRSPAVQSQLNPALANNAANAATGQQSLKDYAAQVLGGQPQAQEFANQETNSISQIYDPNGVQAQLDHLNHQQQGAANIAAQNAAAQVHRQINAQRAGGGSSSYLDRLMAQQLYGIGAQNAGTAAQQGRADLTWLTGQRNADVGQRTNILNTLAQRNLMPVQANQQYESGALNNLGQLANLDYSNHQYQDPQDVYMKRMDFIRSLVQQGAISPQQASVMQYSSNSLPPAASPAFWQNQAY